MFAQRILIVENNNIHDIRERLARVETFSGIDDQGSGLRGEILDLRRSFRELETVVRGMEKRIYFAMGACWIVGFVAEMIIRK